jgi:hypothetical protein
MSTGGYIIKTTPPGQPNIILKPKPAGSSAGDTEKAKEGQSSQAEQSTKDESQPKESS